MFDSLYILNAATLNFTNLIIAICVCLSMSLTLQFPAVCLPPWDLQSVSDTPCSVLWIRVWCLAVPIRGLIVCKLKLYACFQSDMFTYIYVQI